MQNELANAGFLGDLKRPGFPGGTYGWNYIQVTRDDLIAFAWSSPMRELAAKVGISDVGLRKLLVSHGTTLPPQVHRNRVHAGRPVGPPLKAPPRRPGETDRAHVDARLAPFMTEAQSLSATGPFATLAVPEDLEDLRAQELKAIGKATQRAARQRLATERRIAQIVRGHSLAYRTSS